MSDTKCTEFKDLDDVKKNRMLYGPGIVNLVKIELKFETKSPLHIGTGDSRDSMRDQTEKEKAANKSDTETSNISALLLDVDPQKEGAPTKCRAVVPGSAFRGVIRSWLESVLFPFNSSNCCDVASISGSSDDAYSALKADVVSDKLKKLGIDADNLLDPDDPTGKKKLFANKDIDEKVKASRDWWIASKMKDYYLENLDLVAGFFGMGRFKSKVEFGVASAPLANPNVALIPTDIIQEKYNGDIILVPGVSIDRQRGAADDGKLYFVEFVRKGIAFTGEIKLRNVCDWEVGMLLMAIKQFNNSDFPLAIGAHTGSGYGRLDVKKIEISRMGSDSTTFLNSLIDNKFEPCKGETEFIEDFKNVLKVLKPSSRGN